MKVHLASDGELDNVPIIHWTSENTDEVIFIPALDLLVVSDSQNWGEGSYMQVFHLSTAQIAHLTSMIADDATEYDVLYWANEQDRSNLLKKFKEANE